MRERVATVDTPATGAHTLNIRKPYFDLIASGAKTIEVRVGYPKIRKITAGNLPGIQNACAYGHIEWPERPARPAVCRCARPGCGRGCGLIVDGSRCC
ncbi:ASCH domain-containing protein [Streptomyces luteoverticillatus]|uniref:ASCH domain-containing protein n=1 Tax=Streptomyces luteoverticillatus TaxID=66425 RepID=A0A3S9PSE5_STRLT|nr:ASCH domain-containing protein [Streptomyces luteoverticillatus]